MIPVHLPNHSCAGIDNRAYSIYVRPNILGYVLWTSSVDQSDPIYEQLDGTYHIGTMETWAKYAMRARFLDGVMTAWSWHPDVAMYDTPRVTQETEDPRSIAHLGSLQGVVKWLRKEYEDNHMSASETAESLADGTHQNVRKSDKAEKDCSGATTATLGDVWEKLGLVKAGNLVETFERLNFV